MQIFHTYKYSLMTLGKQIWAVTLVLLLLSAEWGAKCETEKIPFVAEVGRYSSLLFQAYGHHH